MDRNLSTFFNESVGEILIVSYEINPFYTKAHFK